MDHILRALGLTRLETRIYRMLLNQGASGVSDISRKTGIHRRNVYDSLERLGQKGLIAYIKENNRRVYSVTNPERIQEKLAQQQQEVSEALPDWLAKFHAVTEKKETLFYRGKAGLRLVFEDQIAEGKEVLVQATTTDVQKVLKHFFPRYQLLRKEKKIPTRMLFDASFASKQARSSIRKLPLAKVRFIQEFNKSPMSQYIYGDNVALVVWSEDPIAIVIRQKAVAEGFRANFEVLWNMAKTMPLKSS